MAENQAQLNGAYNGPAIPPPQSYHRPGRSGCCLLSCLLKIILTTVVVLGLAVLIFWLVVRPDRVKFHVTEANLSEFNFTNNNLYYNLDLNIEVRNPNKRNCIYYDGIEARTNYEDQRFGSDFLDPFYQGHKNTSFLTPQFQGQHMVVLAGDELNDFNHEKGSGIYSIDVTLYLRIRFKIGDIIVDIQIDKNNQSTSKKIIKVTN